MLKRDGALDLAATPEERLLAGQLWDKAVFTEKTGRVSATKFLTPAEAAFAETLCTRAGFQLTLDGGYEGAERRTALFLPDGWETIHIFDTPDDPLTVLCMKPHGDTALSHRDYLGALMGAGIQREAVGDILVQDGTAYCFCLAELAPYLLQNMTQAGRERVTTTQVCRADVPAIEAPAGEPVTATVLSLRLDAVLAAGFGLAREEAKAAVAAGLCSVNHQPVLKPERLVQPGDLLSFKGRGRVRFTETGGETRKGRTFIRLLRYR